MSLGDFIASLADSRDWIPGHLPAGVGTFDLWAVLDALGAVEREAKRRRAGHQPDRRFDLALDVLGDLAELLDDPCICGEINARNCPVHQ